MMRLMTSGDIGVVLPFQFLAVVPGDDTTCGDTSRSENESSTSFEACAHLVPSLRHGSAFQPFLSHKCFMSLAGMQYAGSRSPTKERPATPDIV